MIRFHYHDFLKKTLTKHQDLLQRKSKIKNVDDDDDEEEDYEHCETAVASICCILYVDPSITFDFLVEVHIGTIIVNIKCTTIWYVLFAIQSISTS